MAVNSRISVQCRYCDAHLMRRPFRPYDGARIVNFFCNKSCKGLWQKEQKPVDEAWLRQKYLIEKLSAVDIAKIVNRNSKQVWQWLKGYGIQTRPRGHNAKENLLDGRKPGFKLTDKHKEALRAARLRDGHYPKNPDGSPYWTGKAGPQHPTWNGGSTPERQEVYGSKEWQSASRAAYKAAKWQCQRCGAKNKLHVHHVFPFPIAHLRCAVWNLRILCKECHIFVHSRKNGDREFLPPFGIYKLKDGREIQMGYRPRNYAALPLWLS